ncbi:MAG TPA: 4'-phosphopantetheinyl transferase superfamily protein, partial [Kofleriaceae bacterium]
LLAIAPAPVLAGPDRAPIWPPGILGSITHCEDYACAVVGSAAEWSAIGLDAELVQVLEPEIVDDILLDTERDQDPCVVFSIKEAFYKAVYPRLQRILEFHDVEVRLHADRFEARLVIPDRRILAVIEGRFEVGPERVTSVVAL